MTSTMPEPVFDDLNLIEPRLHARRIDAVTVLSFYLLLLMVLPADLVFAPVGAAGGPATLFGLLVFLLYLGLWLRPGTYLDRGRQPAQALEGPHQRGL